MIGGFTGRVRKNNQPHPPTSKCNIKPITLLRSLKNGPCHYSNRLTLYLIMSHLLFALMLSVPAAKYAITTKVMKLEPWIIHLLICIFVMCATGRTIGNA